MADVSDPAIAAAYQHVRDDRNVTDWAVIGFASPKDRRLRLLYEGPGGLSNVRQHLLDTEVAYAYVRVRTGDKQSRRTKFVLFTWVGDKVSFMRKAFVSVDKGKVKEVFADFSLEVHTSQLSDVTSVHVLPLLKRAMGADYSGDTGVAADNEDDTPPMATSTASSRRHHSRSHSRSGSRHSRSSSDAKSSKRTSSSSKIKGTEQNEAENEEEKRSSRHGSRHSSRSRKEHHARNSSKDSEHRRARSSSRSSKTRSGDDAGARAGERRSSSSSSRRSSSKLKQRIEERASAAAGAPADGGVGLAMDDPAREIAPRRASLHSVSSTHSSQETPAAMPPRKGGLTRQFSMASTASGRFTDDY